MSYTYRHWACQISASPPKPPSSTPGNYDFLSHSSPCDFVLFLRSRFTNSFVKPHKSLLSPVKPSLGKQWRGNSPFHTQRRITETAIRSVLRLLFYSYCRKPQPQSDTGISVLNQSCWFFLIEAGKCSSSCLYGLRVRAHNVFPLFAAGFVMCIRGCSSQSEPATRTA